MRIYFTIILFFLSFLTACETLQEAAKRAKSLGKKGTETDRPGNFKERPSYEPFTPEDRAPAGYAKINAPILHKRGSGNSNAIEKQIYTLIPYDIHKYKKEISMRLGYPTDLKGNYYYLNAQKPIDRIEMIYEKDTCYIKKYTLKEKRNIKPYRITIVLDHSGSMGDDRCRELQNAVSDVFQAEKLQHEINIIKFDSEVAFEGSATNNSVSSIVKRRVGMEGFGGSTSIFDALDNAISNHKIDTNYQPLIILFSDGYENSSKQNDIKSIVTKAKTKNIPIFTSAFGQGADTLLLRTIADETNGAYWQTFEREEFVTLFSNKLFLLNNFYEITMVPCSFDYQKINVIGTTENGQNALGEKTLLGFKEVIVLNINFQFDESVIEKKYNDELDKISGYLKRNLGYNIVIYGHTDDAGTKEYNRSLSLSRAEAVSQALTNRGIQKSRIKTVGKGEEEPYVPNTTEENKYRNRRIEIELIKN